MHTTFCSSALREFWRAESVRLGFDWPSIIATHLTIVDQLRDADAADAQVGCSSCASAHLRRRPVCKPVTLPREP
jgi:hypothetical protein